MKPYQPVVFLVEMFFGPGQVAQLVRASSLYAKVVGSIPSQGNNNQPVNASISVTRNQCFSLSPFHLCLKTIKNIFKYKFISLINIGLFR